MKKPSLSIYYNSRKDLINIGSMALSDKIKYNVFAFDIHPIFDHNMKIGEILYSGPNIQLNSGRELTISPSVIFLPEGDIHFEETTNGKTHNGFFLPDTLYTFPITKGTGDFLFVNGFINIFTDSTGGRYVDIYFMGI
jgi:hypothetical protein